jgi:Na+-driven multidrug efflux pump
MKIIISINLLNIILDYLFVYIFSMNIEGVAYASLIAESSIAFFVINHLLHDKRFMNKNIFLSSLNNLSTIKKQTYSKWKHVHKINYFNDMFCSFHEFKR